jgi:hypothetical protein
LQAFWVAFTHIIIFKKLFPVAAPGHIPEKYEQAQVPQAKGANYKLNKGFPINFIKSKHLLLFLSL